MTYPTYERERILNPTEEDIREVIKEAYYNGKDKTHLGNLAHYIPELTKRDPDAFGICRMDREGKLIEFGETETRFSMQSVSKVVNLALALKYKGAKEVFNHVGMEPSGDAFNSIIKLEAKSDLPYNPMINVGAIQVCSLLANEFEFEEVLDFAKILCKDDGITLNEDVYESEQGTGDRNRAMAYLLKSKGVLQADPEKTLELYFKMCSINVNARSLAGLGLIISNNGEDPITGKHYLHPEYVRILKSIMFTCGLYDASGEFGVKIGMPAKSGVGGGVVCATKGPAGIGIYGPALDQYGNSIAGVAALEHISYRLHLHVFDFV
ncbi:MAG: glutaminase A [Clostridia bacterium]|nr:glutaminase A [Clostridia bacterium]